ncbi:MAG: cyclodeaminase/cyclohydrolase family protein [Ktedonobacteraceae bacterium]
MYIDIPLHTYLDDLASSQSTPGGGSASALTGAIGAGLASMVARLTLGKANYANVQQEIESLIEQTEHLRARFQQLLQDDIDAYGRLSACFMMPRTTDEERVARTQAIQTRLHAAALVPLEVTECAAELLRHCQRIAEIGNKTVLSDIATGTMLASSAGTGASWMVRTNLLAMKDLALVDTLSDRLNTALDTIATCSQQVITLVGEKA